MYKFCFVFDKTFKSQKIKNYLGIYKKYSPKKSDVIIVSGGDGFMLRTLKKYYKYKKPFYGINSGTIGFLMNKFQKKNLVNLIKKAKSFSINPLKVKISNFKK